MAIPPKKPDDGSQALGGKGGRSARKVRRKPLNQLLAKPFQVGETIVDARRIEGRIVILVDVPGCDCQPPRQSGA